LNIDPNAILLALIPNAIGFVLLVYGKKQARIPQMIAGLLFLAYPYVIDTTLPLILVGLAIGAGLWLALRLGW
jgi:hypothetical protein